MPLCAARTMLVQDRMDWNRPHLRWLKNSLYRTLRPSKG